MRFLPLLVSLAAGASAGTVTVGLSKFDFKRAVNIGRRDTLNLEAINNITGASYYGEFEIGTPGQKLSFILDTGSSDTWFNSDDTDLCNSVRLQRENGWCTETFNPDESSTFKMLDRGGFDIKYIDRREIHGDYVQDSVTIDGKTITKQQLGLATESVSGTGIMGLGFSSGVASLKQYPTIVDNMVSQGLIETAAFSLWLNDLSSSAGSILFGGIDKAKFIGKLTTLPLLPDPHAMTSEIISYTVALDSFTITTPDGEDDVKLDKVEDTVAILDSGSTINLLPEFLVKEIWDAFDVRIVDGISAPFVDCALAGKKGEGITFDFRFSDKVIRVPMDEMVINFFEHIQEDIQNDPTLSAYFRGWDGVCMFGITSSADFNIDGETFFLLGATFLRSAYVVYDLENEQLGIAMANLNTEKSDIVELKKGDKKFPDVTGVKSQTNEEPSSTDDDDSSTSSKPRVTVTVTAGADSSAGSTDNAAGHLAPAALVTLMMAVGAAMMVM